MTAEEIKTLRNTLLVQIYHHQIEIEVIRARIDGLKLYCNHPNKYKTSHMGENCVECPDCGWSN